MDTIEDILFLEASINYTLIHKLGGKQLHSYTLKKYELMLENNKAFSRIHRKYIVNKNYVSSHSEIEVILVNGMKLPISRRREY